MATTPSNNNNNNNHNVTSTNANVPEEVLDAFVGVGSNESDFSHYHIALQPFIYLLRLPWFFLIIIGVSCSLTYVVITFVVFILRLLQSLILESVSSSLVAQWFVFTGWGVGFTLLTVKICTFHKYGPGTGIPVVKSILTSGVVFANSLDFKLLLVRMSAVATAQVCGLQVGFDAPMLHISAMVTHHISRLPIFSHFHKVYSLRAQMLSAACSVGGLTALTTPIAGVFWGMEVTSKRFIARHLPMNLFSAVFAVLLLEYISSIELFTFPPLFVSGFIPIAYTRRDLLESLIIGVSCGILGACFVWCIQWLEKIQVRFTRWMAIDLDYGKMTAMFVYSGIVALLCNLINLPNIKESLKSSFQFELFSDDPGPYWLTPNFIGNLASYSLVLFVTAAVSATLRIPYGLTRPSFLIGACFGRLLGEVFAAMMPGGGSAAAFAVAGAAGFSASVTRSFSSILIVIELTGFSKFDLPILIVVTTAIMTNSSLCVNLLDVLQASSFVSPSQNNIKLSKIDKRVAADIMRKDVVYVCQTFTAAQVEEVINTQPTWTTFVLVDNPIDRVFIGTVSRKNLVHTIKEARGDVRQRVRPALEQSGNRLELTVVSGTDEAAFSVSSDTEEESGILGGQAQGSVLGSGDIVSGKRSSTAVSVAVLNRIETSPASAVDNETFEGEKAVRRPGTSFRADAAKRRGSSEASRSADIEEDVEEEKEHEVALVTLLPPSATDKTVLTISSRVLLVKVFFFFEVLSPSQLYCVDSGRFVGVISKNDILAVS